MKQLIEQIAQAYYYGNIGLLEKILMDDVAIKNTITSTNSIGKAAALSYFKEVFKHYDEDGHSLMLELAQSGDDLLLMVYIAKPNVIVEFIVPVIKDGMVAGIIIKSFNDFDNLIFHKKYPGIKFAYPDAVQPSAKDFISKCKMANDEYFEVKKSARKDCLKLIDWRMKYIAIHEFDSLADFQHDKNVSAFKQNYEDSISLFCALL